MTSFILVFCPLPRSSLKRSNAFAEDDDQGDRPYFIPSKLPRGPANPGYLPVRLWVIITLMMRTMEPVGTPFDVADLFAGKKAISKACMSKGYNACALDLELDERDES